jgi:hypothetical protein
LFVISTAFLTGFAKAVEVLFGLAAWFDEALAC